MAENEHGTRVPLETQIKENFSAAWNRADTPDKKKSLLQRILQMIKDMAANAQTAVSEAEQEKSGVIPRKARDAKEAAARPVMEFLQFLSGANGQPLDQETLSSLNLDESQQTFLQTLAKKTQSGDSATFLAQIIDRVIDKDKNPNYLVVSKPGEPKTQLEKDFEMVRLNSVAAESMKESLLKLAQEGKLRDAEGNTLKEEDVEERFSSQRQADSNGQNGGEDRTDINQNRNINPRYGRKREAQLDEKQLALYSNYMNRLRGTNTTAREEIQRELDNINGALSSIEQDTNLSNEAREAERARLKEEQGRIENQLLDFDQRVNSALDYIIDEVISPPFVDAAEVRQYLKDKLGLQTEAEIDNAIAILQRGTGTLDGSYEGYQDLASKVNRSYTAEIIKQRVIKDGKIDIDAVQRLQAEIEDDIGVLFETLYNSPKGSFEESFSSYSEGQMLRKIAQHLRQQINQIINEEEDSQKKSKFKQIFNDMIISPIQRRPSLERIVHQFQQVGATINLEKLQDIYKTYNITTLQEFYNDDLTRMINDLMPSFVQTMFIANGNKMINNFFQLVQEEEPLDPSLVTENSLSKTSKNFVLKYRKECIDYMHDVISKTLGVEVSKDRINARFSRAYLDNFLLSLRGIKVMGKALPMREKFGDLPFYDLIVGIFNPTQSWGKFGERGRGHQESGDAETTEYSGMNNFMFNEVFGRKFIEKYGDVFDNFHPAEMKKEGDKRVLYDVWPDNKELMKDLETGRWDVYYTMNEVYRGMVFGNIIDQSGWPFDGFNNVTLPKLAERLYKKDKGELSRNELLELKYRTSGVVTAFWDADGYAGDDTMNMFVRYLYQQEIDQEIEIQKRERGGYLAEDERKKIIDRVVEHAKTYKFNEMDWNKKTGEYTKGDKRFDEIFEVTQGGKKKKMSFREYRLHRINSIRGEIFHQMLLKDPNAWLAEMVQSYPNLSEGFVDVTFSNGSEEKVKASEFYFDLDKYPDSKIPQDLKKIRDKFRFQILTKYRGKEEDLMSNVPHLKKIMDFYSRLYEKFDKKDEALKTLATELNIAHQKAVQAEEASIVPGYIEDKVINELMFGEDGLIPYFNKMVGTTEEERKRYFGDGEANLGEENGFYQRWSFSKEQSNSMQILPEGDTNMKYLLEENENPQALERRLGTDMAFAKAQEVLNKVPGVCKKAADADSFDAWYGAIEELHSEMAVIADEDQGVEQKYQQLLYQTICNWFSVDSRTEKMWTGFLSQLNLGSDIAMATLKSDNMTKFLLDQDNRRQYLNMLRDKSYIKGNYDAIGGWGFSTVELVAGVHLGEIIRKQAIYALVGAAIITLATAMKEGYEEEVEED